MRWLLISILLSITITVSGQGAPFARGMVDNVRPYLGQPILYTLRIYTPGESSNGRVIEPSFAGFGRASINLSGSYSSEVIGTTLYQVVEQPYVLYPLRAGELTIEPFTIHLPETPFQNGMTIFTEAVNLNVQALPSNAPLSFKNAIGQFEIEASISTTELPSGDTFTLSIIVSGTGNLEQVVAPNITLPEGWALFDSHTVVEQDNLRFGRKVFEWTVIPLGEGLYKIPSIDFAFFNPQLQQYETRRTAPLPINLLEGDAPVLQVIPTREGITATQNSVPNIPELKAITISLPPYPPVWFWGLWLIAPVIVFLIWLGTKIQSLPNRNSRRVQKGSRAFRQFRQALKQAQDNEPKAAYLSVEKAIYDYLGAKFGQEISLETLEDSVTELAIPLQEQVMACVEEAHEGQYAPVGKADVVALLKQCLQVFNAVEGELK